ncbi:MAG: hypothetical protein F6J94_07570 [Moorea sp. SIO1F2]|uniref:hypothetical protein n=1 Tax=unclassified Moorena TaxID=2683338 RepID=UPI0013B982E5|nr:MULTISPECIES: hypothetical protein [unclassified Moorena]NEN97131.1 hypothetical protein [Moorena sp. SIO3I7]NEO08501.1 hypothetical protein [Moorena sp. SIO3I8]NET81815.1 hypothetical protein [Moorena sp. SIO1F2]
MKNRQLIKSLSLASAAVIGGNAPAQAIDFDFSYQPGTSSPSVAGMGYPLQNIVGCYLHGRNFPAHRTRPAWPMARVAE